MVYEHIYVIESQNGPHTKAIVPNFISPAYSLVDKFVHQININLLLLMRWIRCVAVGTNTFLLFFLFLLSTVSVVVVVAVAFK